MVHLGLVQELERAPLVLQAVGREVAAPERPGIHLHIHAGADDEELLRPSCAKGRKDEAEHGLVPVHLQAAGCLCAGAVHDADAARPLPGLAVHKPKLAGVKVQHTAVAAILLCAALCDRPR